MGDLRPLNLGGEGLHLLPPPRPMYLGGLRRMGGRGALFVLGGRTAETVIS